MRALKSTLVLMVALTASACETFDDYIVSSDNSVELEGALIRVDLMESMTGERYDQFRAWNGGVEGICAQVVFIGSDNYLGSGYSMGSVYIVQPGETADIGYVQAPSSYNFEGRLWTPQSNGGCGSYESAERRAAAGD